MDRGEDNSANLPGSGHGSVSGTSSGDSTGFETGFESGFGKGIEEVAPASKNGGVGKGSGKFGADDKVGGDGRGIGGGGGGIRGGEPTRERLTRMPDSSRQPGHEKPQHDRLGDTRPLDKAGDANARKPDGRNDKKRDSKDDSKSGSHAGLKSGSKSGSKGGTAKMGSTGIPSPTADEVLAEVAKSATSYDTLVGRHVIDMGFATPDEVSHCLAQSKQTIEENNQRSLADLLVENEYVTQRQMGRLKEILAAERSGQKIPGYKVLGKLGAGAMATVFKAKQLSLDRIVAIKVLPKKLSGNPQFIERFYAEGRAAAQLNHPNIVQAYDVNKAGEYHYFVMEYVEGNTVYDEIQKLKRIPETDAIDATIQVAEALMHAHTRGLIHRDVKPKNIMLTKQQGVVGLGMAKLADMGLARAMSDVEAAEAEAGKAFGTPYYISPEQVKGEVNIGPPADIYSLGATLYHMLTGSVPFDGKNPSAVMHKHVKAELVPPDHVNPKLSAGVSEVIEMMMAKDPAKRYQSCKDLLTDLRAVREKKNPPIAHRDLGGLDLASLAKAEQSATIELQKAPDTSPLALRQPLFIALCVALVFSLIGNVVMLVLRVGS
jgi:eukaryotic-like serine/threonine-protein kinase